MSDTRSKAEAFHQLHQDGILLLANVWDAGTARLVESLGAKALATTSAGVAWSHGYRDGDVLPVERLLETVRAIERVVSIPVSVDIEGGYSDDPAAVGELVAQIIAAGAVGINLEDGSSAPDLLCAKIETVKRTCSRLGVDLFVNARTDVFLRGLAPESARVDETMARGALYRAAGADGIFVPALVDAQDIKAIISGLHLPLNVMARPSLPPASELSALGVRRLSAGSGIAEAAYGRASTLAAGFLRDGASSSLGENAMSYAQINGLMAAG